MNDRSCNEKPCFGIKIHCLCFSCEYYIYIFDLFGIVDCRFHSRNRVMVSTELDLMIDDDCSLCIYDEAPYDRLLVCKSASYVY